MVSGPRNVSRIYPTARLSRSGRPREQPKLGADVSLGAEMGELDAISKVVTAARISLSDIIVSALIALHTGYRRSDGSVGDAGCGSGFETEQ